MTPEDLAVAGIRLAQECISNCGESELVGETIQVALEKPMGPYIVASALHVLTTAAYSAVSLENEILQADRKPDKGRQ